MARHLIERGGKRLRPALVCLAAGFGRPDETQLQLAGAALELMHVASLYHDDVMDRAPQRRQAASANRAWGNLAATLAGTFLFARAAELMANLGDEANRMASEAAFTLCSGQLQEVENAFNLALSEAEHLQILARKTGALFELPCRLGALLGGLGPVENAALADYGRALGVAFQLTDDLLDLAGETEQMGKATQTDLREGIYSLAVLRAVQRGDENGAHLANLLQQASLNENEIGEVVMCVQKSGMISEVRTLARDYLARAQAALESLPSGSGRVSLERLAEFVLERGT